MADRPSVWLSEWVEVVAGCMEAHSMRQVQWDGGITKRMTSSTCHLCHPGGTPGRGL